MVARQQLPKYRVPPSTLVAGSKAFCTPSWAAVSGMSCINPCAPWGDRTRIESTLARITPEDQVPVNVVMAAGALTTSSRVFTVAGLGAGAAAQVKQFLLPRKSKFRR